MIGSLRINTKHSACWVKLLAEDILEFFFPQKIGFNISCKLSPIFFSPENELFPKETNCMQCQSLFSVKNKKYIANLSSAGLGQRMVKVNIIDIT